LSLVSSRSKGIVRHVLHLPPGATPILDQIIAQAPANHHPDRTTKNTSNNATYNRQKTFKSRLNYIFLSTFFQKIG
jgi:hypothetical protein